MRKLVILIATLWLFPGLAFAQLVPRGSTPSEKEFRLVPQGTPLTPEVLPCGGYFSFSVKNNSVVFITESEDALGNRSRQLRFADPSEFKVKIDDRKKTPTIELRDHPRYLLRISSEDYQKSSCLLPKLSVK